MGILNYTDEHHDYRNRVRNFMEKEIRPNSAQWEKDHIVPKEAWRKMGAGGFLCTWVDKAYGGPGQDFLYSVITAEEMTRTGQTGLVAMLHSDIVVPYIDSFGSEEIKKKYLPGCVSGDCITAVAMTEPGAGSDVASIEMTAEDDGDGIVLNGSKTFISNGINCDMVIVAAKDPEEKNKHAAVSLYIVDDGTPGFTRGRHLEKMGMHSQDTAELFFSNCRIPKGNILGEKGQGFMMLMQKLQQERLISAVATVAAMEILLEQCVEWAKTTEVDGRPLSKKQAIKFTLAEMATETKMNRVLLDDAINGHIAGEDVIAQTMMTKYASSEAANLMADRALDLYGEYGMIDELDAVRAFRDLRITTIFAGTTEIMKTIIAQSMGL
jgi:acyl-CoA dehydrogenase